MNINYVFLRHGHGCHNAINSLYHNGLIDKNMMSSYHQPKFHDPELTPIGVDASMHNGGVISKLLNNIKNSPTLNSIDMSIINVVGCSPLIRCMETAYYMTRKWKNPPNKIYIFPHLREIDEYSDNKYSLKSMNILNSNSSYAMKDIEEQKKYLNNRGLLNFFDFSFVEKFYNERNLPGDINVFIKWFVKNFVTLLTPISNLNVYIITHAGVLRDFANEGFVNNSGFILNTSVQNTRIEYKKMISLNDILPNDFYSDYNNSLFLKNRKCKDRCSNICSLLH